MTKRPEDVYEAIAEITHHDATLIKGEGCYSKQECDVLYSVVGRDEVNMVVNTVRKTARRTWREDFIRDRMIKSCQKEPESQQFN